MRAEPCCVCGKAFPDVTTITRDPQHEDGRTYCLQHYTERGYGTSDGESTPEQRPESACPLGRHDWDEQWRCRRCGLRQDGVTPEDESAYQERRPDCPKCGNAEGVTRFCSNAHPSYRCECGEFFSPPNGWLDTPEPESLSRGKQGQLPGSLPRCPKCGFSTTRMIKNGVSTLTCNRLDECSWSGAETFGCLACGRDDCDGACLYTPEEAAPAGAGTDETCPPLSRNTRKIGSCAEKNTPEDQDVSDHVSDE